MKHISNSLKLKSNLSFFHIQFVIKIQENNGNTREDICLDDQLVQTDKQCPAGGQVTDVTDTVTL